MFTCTAVKKERNTSRQLQAGAMSYLMRQAPALNIDGEFMETGQEHMAGGTKQRERFMMMQI